MLAAATRRMRTAAALCLRYRNWPELLRRVRHGAAPTRLILRNGIGIEAPPQNTLLDIVHEVFVRQVYTPAGFEISSDHVILDVGANVGVFTLYAAMHSPRLIHAVEPHPENFACLQRNLRRNEVDGVLAHQVALSDEPGSARLFLAGSSGGHLLFDRNINGPLRESLQVRTVSLPDLMEANRLHTVSLLKLDCEGAEGQVLAATPASCLRRIRRVALEFHDNVSVVNHHEITALLEDAGFACRTDWDGESPFGYLYAIQRAGTRAVALPPQWRAEP
jgi:FkbM family methyltransferase